MRVILEFEIDEDDLDEFEKQNGNLYEWVFGEICQNQGFGFLTHIDRIRETK